MLPLLSDQARTARAVLPAAVHDYYAGGSGQELSRDEAESAWSGHRLRPRVLRDVSAVDTSLELLGTRLATPVLVGPTALHGLAHPAAEPATARGAAQAGSLLVLSTRSSTRIEDVPAGPWWFQAYVLRDRGLTRALAQRAAAAGATALVLTGDVPFLGRRRTRRGDLGLTDAQQLVNLAQHGATGGRAVEQDPSATLDVIGELADATGLPVLVKGVLRSDDARACLDAGAAGVVVSNHGGRQLDRAVATARALPEVAEAVDGRGVVLVDGGLRCGADVLTALALGADAVLLGRPVLWALASGGADGVAACLRAVTGDLAHTMALAGAPGLGDVTHDLLA